jgi:RHS repeat-associated protein
VPVIIVSYQRYDALGGWNSDDICFRLCRVPLRARWYAPSAARFVTEDPLGLSAGLNKYAFAGGDLVNGADPSGLSCYDVVSIWYDLNTGAVLWLDILDHYYDPTINFHQPPSMGGGGGKAINTTAKAPRAAATASERRLCFGCRRVCHLSGHRCVLLDGYWRNGNRLADRRDVRGKVAGDGSICRSVGWYGTSV